MRDYMSTALIPKLVFTPRWRELEACRTFLRPMFHQRRWRFITSRIVIWQWPDKIAWSSETIAAILSVKTKLTGHKIICTTWAVNVKTNGTMNDNLPHITTHVHVSSCHCHLLAFIDSWDTLNITACPPPFLPISIIWHTCCDANPCPLCARIMPYRWAKFFFLGFDSQPRLLPCAPSYSHQSSVTSHF